MPREPINISSSNEVLVEELEKHNRESRLLFANLEQRLREQFPKITFQYIPDKDAPMSVDVYLSYQDHPNGIGERVKVCITLKRHMDDWRRILKLTPIDPKKPVSSSTVRIFIADIIEEINRIE